MDPWLELHWHDVHARLIVYIANQLQPQLPEPLVARAEEDILVDAADHPPQTVRPDVSVVEERSESGQGGVAVLAAPAVSAKPFLVRVAEPEIDRRVDAPLEIGNQRFPPGFSCAFDI